MRALLFLFIFSSILFSQNEAKKICITIDDLPFMGSQFYSPEKQKEMTEILIKKIKDFEIPAVGFVNENQLFSKNDELISTKLEILKLWIDNNLELGNHTFSHIDLNRNPAENFQNDIIKGEKFTKELLAEKGKELRYFRHPFLRMGMTKEKKDSVNIFLTERNYKIAPVTVDNSDWIFARAFDNAKSQNDTLSVSKIKSAYIPYLKEKLIYYSGQSKKLLGREISQIMLLHANAINSECIDEIAKMMKELGYNFISLEDALKDEAYNLPDEFYKFAGISWLHRWAITQGKKRDFFGDEPAVPKFVMEIAKVDSE